MPVYVAAIIGTILAIGGTVLAWIFILPDKKRARLNKFFKFIHDLFNFKTLWLEKIMKTLYIFSTLACIAIGVIMLFSFNSYDYYSSYSGYYRTYTTYYGGYGVLILLGGPVLLRIIYEFIMLGILAVKNLVEVNKKMAVQPGSEADKDEQEKAAAAAAAAQFSQPTYPQQPVYAQPQQPVYQQPQQPAYQQPQQPAYQQPQQPVYPQQAPGQQDTYR